MHSIEETNDPKTKLSNSGKKRTLQDTEIEVNEQSKTNSPENNDKEKKCSNKKLKLKYELEKEADQLINDDKTNKKYWDDCKELLEKGKKVYNFYFYS